eukprot:gene17623-23200_t
MCICNRNWQANDCSERICQFGLAHVDTPKGDLDMSGNITGPNLLVADNNFVYPYGTTEQFPDMQDTDLAVLTNTAHYYMECSNKGVCDRSTGECQCYDGYDGVACQRASCPGFPNSCSGHGVCRSIKQLAKDDYGNAYRLWDQDSTMGCSCDKGYYGPDCSYRQCKYGVDPLYLDDVATVRYSIYDFAVLTTKTTYTDYTDPLFSDGQSQYNAGHFAIRFYDSVGEDWLTEPIEAGSSCATVIDALEALPNNVIPAGVTECTLTTRISQGGTIAKNFDSYDGQHPLSSNHPYFIAYNLSLWEIETSALQGELSPFNAITSMPNSYTEQLASQSINGYIYRIKFYGNPGKLKQPDIELYLDGKRPSLISPGHKVITKVWSDGQIGESNDYIADHCDGVTVNIGTGTGTNIGRTYLTGFTSEEKGLLKACLGSSDFNTDNNIDVYDWDHGSFYYPHLVKLVRTVTSYKDGGYYAALYYDTTVTLDNLASGGTFRLVNPFSPPDNLLTDTYEVYTTKGTLALTSNHSQATFGFGSKYFYTTNTTYDVRGVNASQYDGDISCTVTDTNSYKFNYIQHCLDKGDIFTFLNWDHPETNPIHINLYEAERLTQLDLLWDVTDKFAAINYAVNQANNPLHFLTRLITADQSTNWGVSINTGANVIYHIYKFFPSTLSTYEYVAPCANRGICDTSSGSCQCFAGYTSDDCSEQSSLAI